MFFGLVLCPFPLPSSPFHIVHLFHFPNLPYPDLLPSYTCFHLTHLSTCFFSPLTLPILCILPLITPLITFQLCRIGSVSFSHTAPSVHVHQLTWFHLSLNSPSLTRLAILLIPTIFPLHSQPCCRVMTQNITHLFTSTDAA